MREFPKVPHFAIVRNKSTTVHHEGDERSRTNPGHGYPAYDETIESIDYEFFMDEVAWERRIGQLARAEEKFTALRVEPVDVEVQTVVKVKRRAV